LVSSVKEEAIQPVYQYVYEGGSSIRRRMILPPCLLFFEAHSGAIMVLLLRKAEVAMQRKDTNQLKLTPPRPLRQIIIFQTTLLYSFV